MKRYLLLNRWVALGLALLVLIGIALFFREGGGLDGLQQVTQQIAAQNQPAPAQESEAAQVIEIDAVEEEQADAEVADPAKAAGVEEPDEDSYDSYIILDDGTEVQEVADDELR